MESIITENPIVRKLIRLKKKHCPFSERWFISVSYWDDGDIEYKLRTCWGNTFYDFLYRYSMNKYFYKEGTLNEYLDMKELK